MGRGLLFELGGEGVDFVARCRGLFGGSLGGAGEVG